MQINKFIDTFSGYSSEYSFYKNEVKLIYDKSAHTYLLSEHDKLIVIPSVTTILKKTVDKSPILIPWGCKMMGEKLLTLIKDKRDVSIYLSDLPKFIELSKNAHRDKLDDAGTVGHQAHHWIESYIKSIIDTKYTTDFLPEEPRAASACDAAVEWMKAHNVRWLATERKVYSRVHKYAGTMDGLALTDSCGDRLCCPTEFKDRKSLIDWKTSNDLYIEYLYQLAAYWGAHEEEASIDKDYKPIEDGWVIRLGKEDGQFEPWHIWDIDEFNLYYYGFLNALKWYGSLEHAKETINLKNEHLRTARKEEKLKKQEAELKTKCKGADKYKGIRKPTCGCKTCLDKYLEKHPEKA